MREIQINIKLGENEFNSQIKTSGFDQTKMMQNSFEMVGILETMKQQILNENEQREDGPKK